MASTVSSKVSIRSPVAFSARRAGAMTARRSLVIRAAGGQGKGGEEGGAVFDKSVFGTIAKNAQYMMLGSLIIKAGLDKTLMDPNAKFTIFAPDDDAFAAAAKKLGVTKLELQNLPNLADILKGHVLSGEVLTSSFSGDVTTVGGNSLKVESAGPSVNGIKLKKKDIKVTNGIIHAIGEVLL